VKVIGYSLLVIGLMCSAQAELNVSLNPEEASLFVYEPFTLMLVANSAIEPPEIPSGSGFAVTGITPVQTNSFRIEMVAEESGTLTVPPITVADGNETHQTAPLRLAISAPRRADEMALSVAFSSTNLYTDQPVKMTVTWNSEVPFTRCQELQLELPVLRDPNWEVYPLDPGVPEKERIGLPVNNQRVIARNLSTESGGQLAFDFMLVPRHAGVTRPSAARLSCALMQDRRASSQYPSYFDNHFFNTPEKRDRFERIYLSAPLPGLTVLALPEKRRTVYYSGIVGPCTATASVQPAKTVVGQPMLLNVELNDLAFAGQIKALPDAVLEGIGSEFQLTLRPMHETAAETSRSFTYVLRPLRSGITTVPAIALQIFDPEQKTYRTLRTEPLSVRVDPDGKQTVYQPPLSEDRKPKIPLTGIRGNWKESRLHMNTYRTAEFVAHNAWAFWLLPPLLGLALRPWLRRLDRCRTDPAYARALRAARNFRRAVKQDEETAWKGYLADRFNLNADAVTFETVEPELEKQNLPSELLQAVRDRFARHDTKHYAPQGTPPRKAFSARELVRKIEKAAPVLLLLIGLLSAFSTAAATPDQLFEQALRIRSEKPDEAQPLFTESALGFEAEKEFLNAGNSWFFAGENGRALANYLSAESLRPFNRQIRESIAFIRTQRTDSFQTLETTGSKISKVWKQFGHWDPAIRIGLLTLLYLAVWALYLTARFIGKTVPRRVWIVPGLLALIPAASLVWSFFQPLEGVVIQPAEARLGPGYAYDKACDTLLHEATEFQWLERRNGWIHARLPDKSEAWLPESACVQIR
jgi:hypothetical protein